MSEEHPSGLSRTSSPDLSIAAQDVVVTSVVVVPPVVFGGHAESAPAGIRSRLCSVCVLLLRLTTLLFVRLQDALTSWLAEASTSAVDAIADPLGAVVELAISALEGV